MIVAIAIIGLWLGVAFDTWIPFALSIVIALGLQWTTNLWMHSHMHKLYEGEEDEHGVKTIE